MFIFFELLKLLPSNEGLRIRELRASGQEKEQAVFPDTRSSFILKTRTLCKEKQGKNTGLFYNFLS